MHYTSYKQKPELSWYTVRQHGVERDTRRAWPWQDLLGCYRVHHWHICLAGTSLETSRDEQNLTRPAKTLYIGLTTPLKNVPGPWYSRFTNQLLKNAVTGGRRIFYIDDLHKKYGPVVRISPNEVAISDAEGFKQIHAVSSKFTKSIWYEKLTHFPRLSVFTMRNPKQHAARRRLFARAFSKSYLRENWEPTVKQKCQLAVKNIKRQAEEGSADVLKWWTFMATDIVGRLGFGESFGMLELGHVCISPFL